MISSCDGLFWAVCKRSVKKNRKKGEKKAATDGKPNHCLSVARRTTSALHSGVRPQPGFFLRGCERDTR